MNRNILIAYSLKYDGEYFAILKAIKDKEEIKPISLENCFTIFDDIYPKELLNLKYPPLVIYYKGNINLLKEDKIAVVGSRMACDYALKATTHLIMKNIDKTIVSGLACGIDAKAHEIADKTIGVLGCGIDYVYPRSNMYLFNKLKNTGLMLSEYPNMVKPLAYHFPFRNRIIISLSKTIYIMQSTKKSGTMTSVNEALELGKEIKVLPYDIYSEYGVNNNELILDGASLITKDEIAF